MDDGPLVVPARQPAGALEDPFGTHALRPQIIDQLVVELDDRLVELDDDQVLVVTRVPDDGLAVAVTGTSKTLLTFDASSSLSRSAGS